MPYNATWRFNRRQLSEYFRKSITNDYALLREQQMPKFLKALLEQPEKLKDLTHLWVYHYLHATIAAAE